VGRNYTVLERTVLGGGILMTASLVGSRGWAESSLLRIDDASLLRQMPGVGVEYRLPKRVFPPELVEKLRSEAVYRKFLYRSFADHADQWTGIPLERWQELISDFAPVSIEGNTGNPYTMGISPFTGQLFRGASMSDVEFHSNPFQCREAGTDSVIYSREEDMPADYPARPNHTENIPHLDGTLHPYRFYVPEKFRDAGPEFNSNRKNWFCPAGEVWRCRLEIIMSKIVPDLTAAVVLNDNTKAVATLAAILDRIADVYPGLPLYIGARAHGFARGPDRKNYLTAAQYRSVAPKQPFINVRSRDDYPFWYVDIYDFSYDKLHWGVSAWTDGVMDQLGWIASAFDVVRDRPETLAFSEKKYGASDAWEKRFRERCLKELEFLALATPPTTGNTSYAYITGAAKVGIAAQNEALFRKSLEIVELYLYNNWSADGMAADAAFNYAMMTQSGILGLSWMNEFYGGVDFAKRYPLKQKIDQLGTTPIGTLLNIYSKHADEHARIFRNQGDYGKPPEPGKLPYADHEASQCLPFYGMTALRGGSPGRRLELIFNHQNTWQHSHYDRLSYQLFSEGIECLPDFGYCIGYIEPDREPWRSVRTGYELMGLPNEDTDRWGPWKWGYADRPEAHNTVMVDNWLYQTSPCQLHGYAGASTAEDPGGWAQFVDAGAESLFADRPNPVDVYRRQVTTITLPNGAPVILDVFRVKGGTRHDLFWHVPGDASVAAPDAGEPVDAPNLSAYLEMRPNYDKLTGKAIQHYGKAGRLITGLRRHAMPSQPWRVDWIIQPSRTLPQPEAYRKSYGNWPELLRDVRLGMWSLSTGSPAEGEVLSARGPWPGGLTITDPANGQTVTTTVGLKDALDFRVLTRQSGEPGLESVFVHVLEAGSPDHASEVADFAASNTKDGVACNLKLRSGGTAVYAVTSSKSGQLDSDGVILNGHMGAALPAAGGVALYDGTRFEANGWGVDLAPGWEARLVGVIGDLAGQPNRSALVIKSPSPLPTDGTLVGQHVYVWHQCSPRLQSIYVISAVNALEGNRWQIDLEGLPPFIQQRASVMKIDPEDPRKMEQTFQFQLLMGRIATEGRRIRFPRTGFETALVENGRANFTVADLPPEGAITKGDPFVVYTIQAGDQVTIPSRFACRGKTTPTGLRVDLTSTGAVSLTVPGEYAKGHLIVGGKTAPLSFTRAKGWTKLQVKPHQTQGGRATLELER